MTQRYSRRKGRTVISLSQFLDRRRRRKKACVDKLSTTLQVASNKRQLHSRFRDHNPDSPDENEESDDDSTTDSDGSCTQNSQNQDLSLPDPMSPPVRLIQNISEADLARTKKVSIVEDILEQEPEPEPELEPEISSDGSMTRRDVVTNGRDTRNNAQVTTNSSTDSEDTGTRSDVEREYMERYHLPKMLAEQELVARCEPHLGIVDDLLDGKFASLYYNQGKRAFEASKSAILSTEEFRKLDINEYVAGYYGLRRQMRIGELVLERYRDRLLVSRSPTLKWWGIADFANYIIAPEILLSLCIEEMNLREGGESCDDAELRERAFELFRKTVPFGLRVADELWET